MKLSSGTIDVLKNFAGINQNIFLQQGHVQETYSAAKTILARATIEEAIPREIGIYDLNIFLNALNLVQGGDIDFRDSHLMISDGRIKIKYNYAHPDIIVNKPTGKNPNIGKTIIKFNLTTEDFQTIMKAARVMQLPEIVIQFTEERGLELTVMKEKERSTTNTYSINLESDKCEPFQFVFDTQDLKMIPKDYEVWVHERGIHLKSDNLQYYVAPKIME